MVYLNITSGWVRKIHIFKHNVYTPIFWIFSFIRESIDLWFAIDDLEHLCPRRSSGRKGLEVGKALQLQHLISLWIFHSSGGYITVPRAKVPIRIPKKLKKLATVNAPLRMRVAPYQKASPIIPKRAQSKNP